jgi:hypothetical protein
VGIASEIVKKMYVACVPRKICVAITDRPSLSDDRYHEREWLIADRQKVAEKQMPADSILSAISPIGGFGLRTRAAEFSLNKPLARLSQYCARLQV